ncbi:helix-turn-helix domain-containing protein [Streptomyces sp. NPDC046866]|uniref:MarR family transcriptional regulator n=1 Tax=Streptomyces sp. NPDC046866 TaxID=3154921 RepID=UPI0034548682
MRQARTRHPEWTFLTNHARVLLAVSRDPGMRLRDVALTCGVTERTVQSIIADLEEAGYLKRAPRSDDGRRNRYAIVPGSLFRHPAEAGHEVEGLLALLAGPHRNGAGSPDLPAGPDGV